MVLTDRDQADRFAEPLLHRHDDVAVARQHADWTGLSFGDDADEFLQSGEYIGDSRVHSSVLSLRQTGSVPGLIQLPAAEPAALPLPPRPTRRH
jgi:hypothetical protein